MEKKIEGFKIYWSPWCPWCAKVRGASFRFDLRDRIHWVNVVEEEGAKEYIAENNNGKKTIPVVECLQSGKWFFESSAYHRLA